MNLRQEARAYVPYVSFSYGVLKADISVVVSRFAFFVPAIMLLPAWPSSTVQFYSQLLSCTIIPYACQNSETAIVNGFTGVVNVMKFPLKV